MATIKYENYKHINETTIKYIRRAASWYSDNVPQNVADMIESLNEQIGIVYEAVDAAVYAPQREEAERKERERSLNEDLRFEVTDAQFELIEAVLGQMSDGYWENNRSYEKFWRDINVEGTNTIVVNRRLVDSSKYNNYNLNTPENVKDFFAHKAKLVHNADLRDSFGSTKLKGHENEHANYLDSRNNKNVNQTYGDIMETIKSLKA